jgi:hypothetical protein
MVSNIWMVLNNEVERMWMEAAMTLFKVVFLHFPGNTNENRDKRQLRVIVVPAKFQTEHLRTQVTKHDRCANLLGPMDKILI